MADEVVRLVLDVDSKDAEVAAKRVDAVEAAMEDAAAAAGQLQAAAARANAELARAPAGGVQIGDRFYRQGQFLPRNPASPVASAGAAQVADLDAVTTAANRAATATHTVTTAMVPATKGTRDWGMAMLQTAQFADDMQYGIRAVIGQVPILLSSFGVGAGVAGVMSVAAVGIGQVVQRWDDLQNALGVGGTFSPAIDQAKALNRELTAVSKTIDELEAKPALTFFEQAELGQARTTRDRIKAEQSAMAGAEAVMAAPTADQQERKAGFLEALAGLNPGEFGSALRTALERTADRSGQVIDPVTGQRRTVNEQMTSLVDSAGQGDAFAIGRIRDLITQAFGRDNPVAAAIREGTPEAVAEWERVTEAAVESGRKARESVDRNLAAMREEEAERARLDDIENDRRQKMMESRRDAETEALNAQGEANEPTSEEMRTARRQALVNDAKRQYRRTLEASMRADLAGAGTGRMGAMRRQVIRRNYQAAYGRDNSRMGIFRRQMVARAGGGEGSSQSRAFAEATQAAKDQTARLADVLGRLQSEGIQAVL